MGDRCSNAAEGFAALLFRSCRPPASARQLGTFEAREAFDAGCACSLGKAHDSHNLRKALRAWSLAQSAQREVSSAKRAAQTRGLRGCDLLKHNPAMNPTSFAIGKRRRSAIVAGATGLVGCALIEALLADAAVGAVHVLMRAERPDWRKRSGLTQHVVDYRAGLPALPAVDDAFCCLGTTIKVAGSQQAFRAVDFDAALGFARAARAAGATRLGLVSALGANASSGVFYNRVKGEIEQAVAALDFESVVIARPSLLLGDRTALGQATRPGERIAAALTRPLGWLMPRSVRPIEAATVARALMRSVQRGEPGLFALSSGTLQVLGA
jgi:uncharacterized protein YbjT (DUF2867 family)